ncbi:MAG: hypothetical protein ABS43_00920 [Bordetella sp. SCN 67-23]|nr:hypothetical protein [Burkholderiales bacterium]ODS76433.1 MAG: hypothetical protein ABS43_00920 [Bordetella sp. SCN 67-23]OJW86830.1 MAG: hypothetical protein BGO71_26185 [Burkholderiales bacterium 67-32]
MKKNFRRYIGLIGMSLALASGAAFALTPGQKLPKSQIAQWGTLTVYDIDGSHIRVIPPQYSDSQDTLVLNEQGVVGKSANEIVVAEASAGVQAVIEQTQPRPVSVKHYEATGITVATYADFAQAVEALRALKAALPSAKVGLPVLFTRPQPY